MTMTDDDLDDTIAGVEELLPGSILLYRGCVVDDPLEDENFPSVKTL
jgi:hypothetical protein